MCSLRFASAAALALLVVILCLSGACGGGFSATTGSGDASVGDGPLVDGTGPGHDGTSASDAPTDGPSMTPGSTVYVATSGMDGNSGLDPMHPVPSIAQGLKVAQQLVEDAGVAVPNVLVCTGTYQEASLQLTFDVGLYGGFDCTTNPAKWTRGTCPGAAYCYPTFGGGSTSTVQYVSAAQQQATLVIWKSVGSKTAVDGFVIQGSTSTLSSVAKGVDVNGTTASPVLSNLLVTGGNGSASGGDGGFANEVGSIGVHLHGQGSPELRASQISGGGGMGVNGSVGVLIESAGANVHGCTVSGGTGSSSGPGISAVGVEVQASLSNPLTEMSVTGTDASGTGGGSAVGVDFEGGGTVQLTNSSISGGKSTTVSSTTTAIKVGHASSVTVQNARIYGGSATAGSSQARGFLLSGGSGVTGATVTIANSIIHAGSVANDGSSTAAGIDLTSTTGPTIVFDSIYTGESAGAAINLGTGVTGATITDDLLLGANQTSPTLGAGINANVGQTAMSCNGLIGDLENTAFVNLTSLYQCTSSVGGPFAEGLLTEVYSNYMETGAHSMTDVVLKSSCSGSDPNYCGTITQCPGTSSACLGALFGTTWSGGDDGVCSAFGSCQPDAGVSVGWVPAAGSPCVLTRGGSSISNYPTDVYGVTRPGTPTIGAVQYQSSVNCH
jgi:hypothetical protein